LACTKRRKKQQRWAPIACCQAQVHALTLPVCQSAHSQPAAAQPEPTDSTHALPTRTHSRAHHLDKAQQVSGGQLNCSWVCQQVARGPQQLLHAQGAGAHTNAQQKNTSQHGRERGVGAAMARRVPLTLMASCDACRTLSCRWTSV
jgi:hypothetical protein